MDRSIAVQMSNIAGSVNTNNNTARCDDNNLSPSLKENSTALPRLEQLNGHNPFQNRRNLSPSSLSSANQNANAMAVVLHQYASHRYLKYARIVSQRYLHDLQHELGVDIPDVIMSLCIEYSFSVDDGMYQLVTYLEHVLAKLNQPYVSKKMLCVIIGHFFCPRSTVNKLAEQEIETHYDNLLRSPWIVVVEINANVISLAICLFASTPKYYRLSR